MASFNWKNYELALFEAALESVTTLMTETLGSFYAVAFHEFYAEYFERIDLPYIAANTVEVLQKDPGAHWSSPDWNWVSQPYATRELERLHAAMSKRASSRDEGYWRDQYSRFIEVFVKTAKRMHRRLRNHEHATKDFAVLVFTNDNEVEVLQRCLTPSRFAKLFPDLQNELNDRRDSARMPTAERLTKYQEDLFEFQGDILQLGNSAIPMLIEVLKDKDQRWLAADLLGELGIADMQAINALRARTMPGSETTFHDTTALALLGDVDFLIDLAQKPDTRDLAVRGICGRFGKNANSRVRVRLDYSPIERLLDLPHLEEPVSTHLNDTSRMQIDASDIDEALRGLRSKHVPIREHAIWALGQRRLGRKVGKQVLPEIAKCLNDPVANVRRLAIIVLSYWKKAATTYISEIRRLSDDPVEQVASAAKHYSNELDELLLGKKS